MKLTEMIRREALEALPDHVDYRVAVLALCDRHDALVAAACALLDYAVNNPKDIRDIPDEIYVPFVSALGEA